MAVQAERLAGPTAGAPYVELNPEGVLSTSMTYVTVGRRGLMVYCAFLLSLGGVFPDDFEFRTGAVEVEAVDLVEGARSSGDAVGHDHRAISEVGPIQQALSRAHESGGEDGVGSATVEVDDERSFYAVSRAYQRLPGRCRASSIRGAYVEYRGVVYVLRLNSGVL